MPSAQVALVVSITLGWVGLVGAHALAMRRVQDYRGSWGALFWAFFPALLSALFLTTDHGVPVNVRNSLVGALGGAIGVTGAIWLAHAISDWRANADQLPITAPADRIAQEMPQGSGNFSINQQGGTVNQTYINQNQPKLTFTDAIAHELLSKIPNDKPIRVRAVGSVSDLQVGIQIANFLKKNGYKVELDTIGILAPPPEHALEIRDLPSERILTVTPAVRN